MIVLRNVTKFYPARGGRKFVLRDVSVTFKRGQTVGILGRNGAGKSTLIRLLAKADYPERGRIIHGMTVSWPLGSSGSLQSTMTGRENVRFVTTIYNVNYKSTLAWVMDFTELGRYIDMPLSTYSQGMRARLAFSLSIAIRFDCYLVDEMSAAGDAQFRKKSEGIIDRLRGDSSFIIVSHQTRHVAKMCEVAYVLHEGHLIPFKDVAEAIDVYENL